MQREATTETRALFANARREFERWRRSRPRGARIPDRLWQMAMGLARDHGVSKTAQALHLDYYVLQHRLAASRVGRAQPRPTAGFIELTLPTTPPHAARSS